MVITRPILRESIVKHDKRTLSVKNDQMEHACVGYMTGKQ